MQYTHKIKSNWAKSHVLPLWLTCIVRPIYKQGCSIMLFIILVSFLAKRSSYEGIFEHVSRNFSNFLGNTPACCLHTLLMDDFRWTWIELLTVFWRESAAGSEGKASKQCSCCFPHQCTCCGQHRPTAATASWLTHPCHGFPSFSMYTVTTKRVYAKHRSRVIIIKSTRKDEEVVQSLKETYSHSFISTYSTAYFEHLGEGVKKKWSG